MRDVLLVPLLLALGGCNAPPREFDPAALKSPAALSELGDHIWRADEPLIERDLSGARAALVEFAIEFVDTKMEAPTGSQLAVTPPLPVFLAIDLFGTQRRNIDWGPLRESLPEELLALTLEALEARGVEVVSMEEVLAAKAWSELETAPESSTGFAQRLNLVASDTGRIKALSLEAAEGRHLIQGPAAGGSANGAQVRKTLRALAKELDLDLALRLRVRVGVYQKRLSLERGSVIEVVTLERRRTFTARRSIFSPEPVIDEAGFAAVNGATYTLDEERALDAARDMYRPFLRLILQPSPEQWEDEPVEAAAAP